MSATEDSIKSDDSRPEPSRRTSDTFCAADADVTFVSSDDVLFHVHKRYLDTATAGFPPAGFDASGEIVPLTENAATLELLFQYVYPQRHPLLEATPFEVLSPLAEAAEKYQVFSAMNICYVRMRNVLPEHALEIFNYAARHGYNSILNDAAPALLDIPFNKVVKTLAAHMVVPWVCYREAWSRAATAALSIIPIPAGTGSSSVYCSNCGTSRSVPGDLSHPARAWFSLGDKRSRTALEAVYGNPTVPCSHLSWAAKYLPALERELDKVPSFDTFFKL